MSILRTVGHNLIGYDIFGGGGNLSSAQDFLGIFILSETYKFRYLSYLKNKEANL